jgi:hypothetical protein
LEASHSATLIFKDLTKLAVVYLWLKASFDVFRKFAASSNLADLLNERVADGKDFDPHDFTLQKV